MQLAKRSWCYALHLHMQLITCNMLLKCWRKCPFWSLIKLLPKRKVNVNSQAKSNKHPKLGVQNHMTISWANCYIALWWYIYILQKRSVRERKKSRAGYFWMEGYFLVDFFLGFSSLALWLLWLLWLLWGFVAFALPCFTYLFIYLIYLIYLI